VGEGRVGEKWSVGEGYPFGLLGVRVASLARVHASSGTHGKPTVVGYTPADLEAWTELMARCMTLAGVRPGMLVHNANTYGLFTGGHGFHQGGGRRRPPVGPGFGGVPARRPARPPRPRPPGRVSRPRARRAPTPAPAD